MFVTFTFGNRGLRRPRCRVDSAAACGRSPSSLPPPSSSPAGFFFKAPVCVLSVATVKLLWQRRIAATDGPIHKIENISYLTENDLCSRAS